MADKSKGASAAPPRKPSRFRPKIPSRKKNPSGSASNIVDSDRARKSKGEEPIIRPWRRPSDKSQETLDEEEFGEASASAKLDETDINTAEELGLTKGSEQQRMLFFQLPKVLPLAKPPAVAVEGEEIKKDVLEKGCSFKEMPAGYMGKMLVYENGIVKMKLGDTIFNVSPGVQCSFAQDVAVINTKEKHYCTVGKIDKRAIVSLDVDYLLDSNIDSDGYHDSSNF